MDIKPPVSSTYCDSLGMGHGFGPLGPVVPLLSDLDLLWIRYVDVLKIDLDPSSFYLPFLEVLGFASPPRGSVQHALTTL